jgi:hypothetical protein
MTASEWKAKDEAENDAGVAASMLTDCISDLATAEKERDDLRDTLIRKGYRYCDIAACNCGGWHQGNAERRLDEIKEAIEESGGSLNGSTILREVEKVVSRAERAEALLREERDMLTKLCVGFDPYYLGGDAFHPGYWTDARALLKRLEGGVK